MASVLRKFIRNFRTVNQNVNLLFTLKREAEMKFLRHLLGITKLDKEKNQCIREENGSREYSKGKKTVPRKVATTHTEDGHKKDT